MIQIDHGIPMPPRPPQGRPRGAYGKRIYPWRKMAVGDSFPFPGDLRDAWQRVHGRKAHDPWRYEPRWMQGQVRIWRTA